MRTDRHRFLARAILLILPLIFGLIARGDSEKTKFRWDMISVDFTTSPSRLVGPHQRARSTTRRSRSRVPGPSNQMTLKTRLAGGIGRRSTRAV
jgi:hypothetical protein